MCDTNILYKVSEATVVAVLLAFARRPSGGVVVTSQITIAESRVRFVSIEDLLFWLQERKA